MSIGEIPLQHSDLSEDGASFDNIEAGQKRKSGDDDAKPTSKRAKRKKSRTGPDPMEEVLDVEKGINKAIAHMNPQLLADHIAQRNRRHQPDLSATEFEELLLPASAIKDTSTWRSPRDLATLPKFLEVHASKRSGDKTRVDLAQAPAEHGSPHTLVIAGAALRAADLTRALRKFQTRDSKVEKLFAKHIKLKDAIESCKSARIGIGVGTPQRIHDLLDNGALQSAQLQTIVVDASHIDSKKRGVFDMKETMVPLMALLKRPEFSQRYHADTSGLDLLFY